MLHVISETICLKKMCGKFHVNPSKHVPYMEHGAQYGNNGTGTGTRSPPSHSWKVSSRRRIIAVKHARKVGRWGWLSEMAKRLGILGVYATCFLRSPNCRHQKLMICPRNSFSCFISTTFVLLFTCHELFILPYVFIHVSSSFIFSLFFLSTFDFPFHRDFYNAPYLPS